LLALPEKNQHKNLDSGADLSASKEKIYMANTSAIKRGWHWDEANSKLSVYVDGVEAGYFTTSGAYITVAGTGEVTFGSDATYPTTSDSNALGTTSNMWSDLFLASGGVINFSNGNVTLTHSSAKLTLSATTEIAIGTSSAVGKISFYDSTAYIHGIAAGKIEIWAPSTDSNAITLGGKTVTGGPFHCYSDMSIAPTKKLYFDNNGGGEYITNASGGYLDLHAAGTIRLYSDAQLTSNKRLYFRDGGLYIYSDTDGRMWFSSDGASTADFIFSGTGLSLSGCYLILHKTDTDGSTEGQVWYDNSEDKIKYYAASAVRTVVVEEATGNFTADQGFTGTARLYLGTGSCSVYSPESGKLYITSSSTAGDSLTLYPAAGGAVNMNGWLHLMQTTSVSSREGDVWYDATTNKIHFYDGSNECEVTSTTV
jgi:hypothetical protein